MRLSLYRKDETPLSTIGDLFCDGKRFGFMLEPPGPQYLAAPFHRIPAGSYKIAIFNSPHFQRAMPLLRDTPGCPMCEIHTGNIPGASHGCLVVGKQKTANAVWHSKEAFSELYPAIETAVEQTTEGCSIEIHDAPLLCNHDAVNDAVVAD